MNGQAPPSISKLNQKWINKAVPDPCVSFGDSEVLPSSLPHQHYEISTDVQHKIDLVQWLSGHQGDLATKVHQYFICH